jgi:hypothetical protein
MARLLDLPEHWVRDHARRRLIPSCRVGHYVRFDPVAVISAVKAIGGAQDHPSCGPPAKDTRKINVLGANSRSTNSRMDARSVQRVVAPQLADPEETRQP